MTDKLPSEPQSPPGHRKTTGLFFVVGWRSIAVLTALSLLAAILLWIFTGPFWPRSMPRQAAAATDQSRSDITAAQRNLDKLDNKIAALRQQLADKRLQCRAQPVRQPPPPLDKDEICRLCRNNIKRLAGNMSLSLTWQGFADLDLHLICPNSSHIFYNNKQVSQCDARLNIDKNAKKFGLDRRPIENISLGRNAPQGKYRVEVEYYRRHVGAAAAVPFKLNITRNNRSEVKTGSVHYINNKGSGRRLVVFEFEIKPPTPGQVTGPEGINLDCSICRNNQ